MPKENFKKVNTCLSCKHCYILLGLGEMYCEHGSTDRPKSGDVENEKEMWNVFNGEEWEKEKDEWLQWSEERRVVQRSNSIYI